MGRWAISVLAAAGLILSATDGPQKQPSPALKRERLVEAKAPPFTEGIFPCSQCHTGDFNRTRRALEFHEEIQKDFRHDNDNRWCLDCHDEKNRDVLRLSSGAELPFTESYKLCGQCHGDKYRDWRRGVHGKRVGEWNGAKTYFLCVNCHNPHAPGFQPIKPHPRPQRPQEMKR